MADEIIVWDAKYATGVNVIDIQHRQLVKLANELYAACIAKGDKLQSVFKESMKRMVDYVHYHFDAELVLLNKLGYPDYANHKKMHEDLIKKILDAVKDHDDGKKFVPNKFVRTLVDWVFSHIAFYDKQYSLYVAEKIRTGAISPDKMKEIEASIA